PVIPSRRDTTEIGCIVRRTGAGVARLLRIWAQGTRTASREVFGHLRIEWWSARKWRGSVRVGGNDLTGSRMLFDPVRESCKHIGGKGRRRRTATTMRKVGHQVHPCIALRFEARRNRKQTVVPVHEIGGGEDTVVDCVVDDHFPPVACEGTEIGVTKELEREPRHELHGALGISRGSCEDEGCVRIKVVIEHERFLAVGPLNRSEYWRRR